MSDKRLLLTVAAEVREFQGLLDLVESRDSLPWPVDFAQLVCWRDTRAVLVANGPGTRLAAEAVRTACARTRFAAFLSVGFCGGLDPKLEPNDIFIADEVIGCGRAEMPVHVPASYKHGRLISSDRVAVSRQDKAVLYKTGADAVDMEAAAVAAAAKECGVPFYCIRVITDTAKEDLPLDFNRLRATNGRFSRPRILVEACRKPGTLFPKLMKLNQTCKSASRALGEFIANCGF